MRISEGKIFKREYGRNNNGYTLVELVVSMALTAILATAVASMMFPIISIFMDMQKLSRAQMVADMVTEALRKECASAYVTGGADVRVLDVPDPSDHTIGDNTMTDMLKTAGTESLSGGNTLVFRINEGYAKAVYWNTYISAGDYDEVRENDTAENQKMDIVTSRAVYRLIPTSQKDSLTKETMPAETRPGYLHCAYYSTDLQAADTADGKKVEVFSTNKAYDYTNPFSVSAYNGYTVSIDYSQPVYQTVVKESASIADKRPVYVVATIKVYNGDFENQNNDTLICSREAVLCFAEDNKRETK